MKKIYNIKIANAEREGVVMAVKEICKCDVHFRCGVFSTWISIFCDEKDYNELIKIIKCSGIKIKD